MEDSYAENLTSQSNYESGAGTQEFRLASDHYLLRSLCGGHVEEILRELFESGFGGFLSLEPHLATFDGFGRLEKGGGADKDALTGPEAYALAYRALKKILARLGVSVKPL